MSRARIASLAIGIGLLLAAGILLFTYSPPEPEARPPVVRPAETMVLESAEDSALRSYTGRVQASRKVDLSFRVSGPLIKFAVKGSEDVAENAVLARIDPRDFEVTLRILEAQLDISRAQLEAMKTGARPEDILRLRAGVRRAEAGWALAKRDYDIAKELLEHNAISEFEFQRKTEALRREESELLVAQESLRIGEKGAREEDLAAKKAEIRAIEASRDAAKDRLADTTMRAPFAGKIARTFVDNFQFVQAKQPILRLQDVKRIQIVADVPESVVALVERDMVERITAHFDFLPSREFEVKFAEAETEADARTQTFAITLEMDAPGDVKLLPGMTATLSATLKPGEAGAHSEWLIPADAILADSDGVPHVWKVDASMMVSRVRVAVGSLRGTRIVVRSGVAAGDRIVTAGVRLLQPGQQIRLMEAEAR
jgi:membrane fusion protein, multidrug efflux system